MRLRFELPEGWRAAGPGGRSLVADREPGVVVEVGPLVALEDFHPGAELRRGPDPVEIVDHQQGLATDTGWPMELIRAQRRDALGAVIEVRLGALYVMACYGGFAMARFPAERLAALRAPLVQILRSARPSFRTDEPLTIGELFELAP
jgi:hypothetical protein